MKQFFSRLSYSFGNEDWKSERAALKIAPTDRVICITASGDRPLHALLDPCQEVVAIDLNPIQNHLLILKMTALKHLEYQDYLEFLGINPAKDRKVVFNQLSAYLPAATSTFWQQRIKMIENGILYQGTIETLLKITAPILKILRPKKISKLFSFESLADQRQFIRNEWSSYFWNKAFELIFNPIFTKYMIKDPGLYENLPSTAHPGKYINDRIYSSLNRHLAKENLLMSQVCFGKVIESALPPYLTYNGSQTIRLNLDRITIQNFDIINYLEHAPDNSFDCYSLSDVISYLTPPDFQRLLNAIYRTARPGARFCMRQFISNYSIPDKWQDKFCRSPKLEKHLEENDRSMFYRFTVGTLNKPSAESHFHSYKVNQTSSADLSAIT